MADHRSTCHRLFFIPAVTAALPDGVRSRMGSAWRAKRIGVRRSACELCVRGLNPNLALGQASFLVVLDERLVALFLQDGQVLEGLSALTDVDEQQHCRGTTMNTWRHLYW